MHDVIKVWLFGVDVKYGGSDGRERTIGSDDLSRVVRFFGITFFDDINIFGSGLLFPWRGKHDHS